MTAVRPAPLSTVKVISQQSLSQARAEPFAVFGASVLFATVFSWPLLQHLDSAYLVHDWDRFRSLDWSAINAVSFHQFPAWSPYLCGGNSLLANPDARMLSPWFLLHLAFGSTAGFGIEFVAHLAILWAGGYVLGRVLGLGWMASAGMACVAPSSSWPYARFGAGGPHHFAFAYTPWLIALFLLGVRDGRLRWPVLMGAIMALSLFEAGLYPVTDSGLLIALLAVILSVERRDLRPLKVCAIAFAVCPALAAPKILPVMASGRWRHTAATQDWFPLSDYWAMLFSHDVSLSRYLPWLRTGRMAMAWVTAYLSPEFIFIGAIGAVFAPRQARPWLILAGIFFVLALGNTFGNWSPSVLLHYLPVFSALRLAARYFIMVDFCLAVLVGLGIEYLGSFVPRILALRIVLAGVLVGLAIGPPDLVAFTPYPPVPSGPFKQHEDPIQREDALQATGTRYVMAGQGVINCFQSDDFALPIAAVAEDDPAYKGEVYLVGPGIVHEDRWSPEELRYIVDTQGSTLVINQNYDSGWQSTDGEVVSYDGLLAVKLTPGFRRVTLWYSSRAFNWGCLIALATLAALLLAPLRLRSRLPVPPTDS